MVRSESENKKEKEKKIPTACTLRYVGKAAGMSEFLENTIKKLEGENKNVIDQKTIRVNK